MIETITVDHLTESELQEFRLQNDDHTYRISISDIKNSPSPNIGEEISVYFQEDDIVAYFEE